MTNLLSAALLSANLCYARGLTDLADPALRPRKAGSISTFGYRHTEPCRGDAVLSARRLATGNVCDVTQEAGAGWPKLGARATTCERNASHTR